MALEVELNLGSDKKPHWQKVKLLFVRALKDNATSSSKDWALFLCTDTELEEARMLQIYSLRWSIEVYFKESKGHLGYLKQQTRSFASFTASGHLCAIRYLFLLHLMLQTDAKRVSDIRNQLTQQLTMLSFAEQFWNVFRTFIQAVLYEQHQLLAQSTDVIMHRIDQRVNEFIVLSLQLDAKTMHLEHDPTGEPG